VRLIKVTLAGTKELTALLDEGAECVSMTEEIWSQLGVPMNRARKVHLAGISGQPVPAEGCVEFLEIDVEGFKTWSHVYVVKQSPYDLILGRPWQKAVKMSKVESTVALGVIIHD
ncbi:hypothetical protein FB446DRAFT_619428, partial [Lentinula raphanica]